MHRPTDVFSRQGALAAAGAGWLGVAVQTLAAGIALGFSIAAPPGPVTALSVQRAASRSWFSGWLVSLGATVADGAFFAVTYLGMGRLLSAELRGALFVPGGVLMLYLALSTARRTAARAGAPPDVPRGQSWTRSPFLAGLSMGLTNPYQLGWWVAVGGGMVSEYGGGIAAGFFAGIFIWTLALAVAVHASARRYRLVAPYVSYASAALMGCFGAWFLWSGLTAVF
ncbi:MAG: LysE family transporter [Nitrososphaerota archaeon]|nr:LysE family transporter [Nitrososphaerota archaeon]MDG6978729.1 LysE family transporter [Nitrososphaerota archaeon]MDG7022304.1 LysE family transporter [Nitrososphaerota archaeon]